MFVSDFAKDLLVKALGSKELHPSLQVLHLAKLLESDINEQRIRKMMSLCKHRTEQSPIDDIESLNFALEYFILGFPLESNERLTHFIHELNLDSRAIDVLLLNRIAIYAQIISDESLLALIQGHAERQIQHGKSKNLFYQLANLIVSEGNGGRQKEIDYLLDWTLKEMPMDDEFCFLYSVCVMNGILDYHSNQKTMNDIVEHIEEAIAQYLGTVISTKKNISSDSKITRLLFASRVLDRESRRIRLAWANAVDSDELSKLRNLCREQPELLLQISRHLMPSRTLLNEIKSDESLLLSYWIGAALILLEVGVTRSIESIDEGLYERLKNAKFDEKLKKFEEITDASIEGVLTKNFYRIRNSVVHGETGLSFWDLEIITDMVTKYLRRVL